MNQLIIFDAEINRESRRFSIETKPTDAYYIKIVLLRGGAKIVKDVSMEEVLKGAGK